MDAREIRAGFKHVAGLRREELDLRGLAEQLLQHLYEEHGLDGTMMAEVEDADRWGGALGGRVEQHLHDAVDDVVDVGEIAKIFPLVEKLQRLPRADRARKKRRCHVGATPRAVDGEKAQTSDVEAVHVRVTVRDDLVGLLRRAVERDGLVGVVVLAKRRLRPRAVDAAAGGEHEVFRRRAAASFEHTGKSVEVAVRVSGGLFDAVAHARLRAEVDDVGRFEVRHERGEFIRVGEISLHKTKLIRRGVRCELIEPRTFERRIIVVADHVHAEHFAAFALGQTARDVITDEAGGAGHEDFHPARDTRGHVTRLARIFPRCRVAARRQAAGLAVGLAQAGRGYRVRRLTARRGG